MWIGTNKNVAFHVFFTSKNHGSPVLKLHNSRPKFLLFP